MPKSKIKSKSHKKNSTIVVLPPPERPWSLSTDEALLVKNHLCKGASDDELKFLLAVARRYKLDPLKQGQIWFIPRWDSQADNGRGGKGTNKWVAQMGIYGMATIAARDHSDYGGFGKPQYGPEITIERKDMQGAAHKLKGPQWCTVEIFKIGRAHV